MTTPFRAGIDGGNPDAAARGMSASPDWRGRVLSVLGAFAVLFVVLFWRLGAPSFWDPDEAHYAQTTREMIVTGDWLAPYFNEQPFFDKPILFYWLQGAAMTMAGPTEFSARLVPAVAALALVGVTGWLGVRLIAPGAAWVAVLLLATSPGLFGLARYAILDTLFTVLLFGGAALVSVSALDQRPRLQWPGYVLLALAVLTKGPLALVLCGLAFAIAILLSAEVRRRLLELRLVMGLALVLAIAAPWFAYMWLRFGDAFLAGYLLDENVRLYAGNRFGPGASTWFYFRVLAAGFLPWTPLLVGRLYDDIRAAVRRDGTLDRVDVLLWSWTIAIVGFFTFSNFKLDHYVFPATPALCLICGRAWVALSRLPREARHRGTWIGMQIIGPLMVAASIAGGYVLLDRLALPMAALVIPLVMGIAGIVVMVQASLPGARPPRVPWAVIGAMSVVYAGLVFWVMPTLDQRKAVPELARWVAARATDTDRIASYRLNRWRTAFRFYVGRHVWMIDEPDGARKLFSGSEPFYCAMLGPAYEEFVAQGVPLRIVYQQEGMWATSGRVLWRRQLPPTRFVVVTGRDGGAER